MKCKETMDGCISRRKYYEKENGVEYAKETIENAKKGIIYNMVFTLENGNYVYSYTEPSSK